MSEHDSRSVSKVRANRKIRTNRQNEDETNSVEQLHSVDQQHSHTHTHHTHHTHPNTHHLSAAQTVQRPHSNRTASSAIENKHHKARSPDPESRDQSERQSEVTPKSKFPKVKSPTKSPKRNIRDNVTSRMWHSPKNKVFDSRAFMKVHF